MEMELGMEMDLASTTVEAARDTYEIAPQQGQQ